MSLPSLPSLAHFLAYSPHLNNNNNNKISALPETQPFDTKEEYLAHMIPDKILFNGLTENQVCFPFSLPCSFVVLRSSFFVLRSSFFVLFFSCSFFVLRSSFFVFLVRSRSSFFILHSLFSCFVFLFRSSFFV